MKQYVTMKKINNSLHYEGLEVVDHKFAALTALFSPYIRKGELITWFYDEKKTVNSNEYMSVRKEHDNIVIYDLMDQFCDEYAGLLIEHDPAKCFIMSKENFSEIIHLWDELRISRPETILVVIHEDNHVSLETDPLVIQAYQDAGYAFDVDKV